MLFEWVYQTDRPLIRALKITHRRKTQITTAALRSFVATHLTVASDARLASLIRLNLKRLIVFELVQKSIRFEQDNDHG